MMFFFLTLVVLLIDYFIGALIPPTLYHQAKGFSYWHEYVIFPYLFLLVDGFTFFGVFGVFFPSVTGIFTGASMSADLKDPATAIPKGTFLAIATTSTMYAIIVIFTGFTIVAYATGNPGDIMFNNLTCEAASCPYGLINDYQTMSLSGALSHTGIKIEPLVYAGIFAATLSSGLGCYTAAPRIFQVWIFCIIYTLKTLFYSYTCTKKKIILIIKSRSLIFDKYYFRPFATTIWFLTSIGLEKVTDHQGIQDTDI